MRGVSPPAPPCEAWEATRVADFFLITMCFPRVIFDVAATFAREMNKLASAVDWGSKSNSLDDILREITAAKIQVHTDSASTPTNLDEAAGLMGWLKSLSAKLLPSKINPPSPEESRSRSLPYFPLYTLCLTPHPSSTFCFAPLSRSIERFYGRLRKPERRKREPSLAKHDCWSESRFLTPDPGMTRLFSTLNANGK